MRAQPQRSPAPRWAVQLATTLAAILMIVPAPAATGGLTPAQQVIATLSDDLARALREERLQLETDPSRARRLAEELFLPNIDLERVSALTLGQYWRDATPAQRAAFATAFRDLVLNSYAHSLNQLGPWELRFLPQRPEADPDRAMVRTLILQPGSKPLAVDYRMARSAGRWRAYDVILEGVSLLANYRNLVAGIARDRGVDGVIREIERRNATASGAGLDQARFDPAPD